MLGKRPRPATKRTASMSDVKALEAADEHPPPQDHRHRDTGGSKKIASGGTQQLAAGSGLLFDQWLQKRNHLPPPPPATNLCRRQSAGSLTTHFLQSCRLCTDRLVPGRDIYMYRGDSAFCSEECRQQQILQDERKEKCLKIKSNRLAPAGSSSATATAVSESVATM